MTRKGDDEEERPDKVSGIGHSSLFNQVPNSSANCESKLQGLQSSDPNQISAEERKKLITLNYIVDKIKREKEAKKKKKKRARSRSRSRERHRRERSRSRSRERHRRERSRSNDRHHYHKRHHRHDKHH